MVKEVLCRFPLPVKILMGKVNTLKSSDKRKAISEIDNINSLDFPTINTENYKKNLRDYLYSCDFNAKETHDYIYYLYHDEVQLLYRGEFKKGIPTILCVVKNESDKLKAFFKHYQKLGDFNYIFIDNGSSDSTIQMIKDNSGTVYTCTEPFSTNRKLSWINKVYSTLPDGEWTILLDADELLVFDGYENIKLNAVLNACDKKGVCTCGAVMIDMFSKTIAPREKYIESYIYFENRFHEERSFYFNSVYGGIREREFKFGKNRIFLIKKHPVVKKDSKTMLIHCHYIYPFKRNFESEIYFGLLHYKLFDREIEKYRAIANEGGYEDGSLEYKTYLKIFSEKTYEQIFEISKDTELYRGTTSLRKIKCLHDVSEIM